MAVRVSGKVIGISADRDATIIQLDNDPSIGPKDNVWKLMLDHGNYNALYSLAIAAAANRWTVSVRIQGGAEIDPQAEAAIKNIGASW